MWRPITDFNSKRILQDFITSLQNTNSSEAERILFLAMFLTAFYGFFRIAEFAAKSASFCTVILYDSIRVGSLTSAGKIHSLIMNEDNHHSFQTQNAQSPLWHYNHRRRLLALLSQIRALGRWKSDAFKFYIRNSTQQAIKFERVRQG